MFVVDNQQLDDLGIELDVVEVRYSLLFSAEDSRPEARGQIRCGHLVLLRVL